MANTSESLSELLTNAWAELGDMTHLRGGYAGLAVLATQTESGPEMRQMVIRGADRRSATVTLHTDRQTAKCTQIGANSKVSLLVWRAEGDLQIRATAQAEILGAYAAKQVWADLPFATRGNYGVTPAPGTPIKSPDAYQRSASEDRLAVINLHIRKIDVVRLATPLHYRAMFEVSNNWAGTWLAP